MKIGNKHCYFFLFSTEFYICIQLEQVKNKARQTTNIAGVSYFFMLTNPKFYLVKPNADKNR